MAFTSLTIAPEAAPAAASARAPADVVRERISILRLVLICGILFIHIPVPDGYVHAGDGVFAFLRAFVCDGLFRATVPTLTAISGYLLFRSGLDRRTRDLLAKKSRTLLLPLLAWNLPFLVALYAVERVGFSGHAFGLAAYPFDVWTWANATFGILGQPVNFPLYFLRDLFVLSLLSPLFGWLLRRAPILGLIVVSVVFWYGLEGPLLLRDVMGINFYLGGLAAVCGWRLTALDRFWPACLAVLLLASAVIAVGERPEDLHWFTLVAPLLVWPLASRLQATRLAAPLARASTGSFAIFLVHAPLLLALSIAFEMFARPAWYPLFWLLAPVPVIAAALLAHRLAYRLSPRLAALAFGSR